LKVIFMSGYSAEVLASTRISSGEPRVASCRKPSSSRVILETVRRTLDEKEPAAARRQAVARMKDKAVSWLWTTPRQIWNWLVDTLTVEGYQVLPALSGELALAAVAARRRS